MSHYVRVRPDDQETPCPDAPTEGDTLPERRYSIGELAELGGVSRRTVRYYVTRELVPPPTGVGRGAYYTDDHLERLVRVRDLQAAGVPLTDIPRHLDGATAEGPHAVPSEPAPRQPPPMGSRWARIEVVDGVELHVRDGALTDDALATLTLLLSRHARAPLASPRSPQPPTPEDPDAR